MVLEKIGDWWKIKEKIGLGITLTSNETKDMMRVIKSLENRKKILVKKEDF